ncbi:MAG: hypothetical protein KAW56_05995 [Candidatus Marinimicrobia bacterium]|nr:hypothetical protein [Candidatus Neomarinimicrobiota bacterium]
MEYSNYIIHIILASCAILSSIFAATALIQTFKLKKDEKESKRAFIAPCKEAGYLKLKDMFDSEPCLILNLKNFGTNPAEKITVKILGFNKFDIDGTNQDVNPIIKLEFNSHNPIPYLQELTIEGSIHKLNYMNITDMKILASNYIYVKIVYYDRILVKTFEENLYWHVGENGRFSEVSDELILSLKQVTNNYFNK